MPADGGARVVMDLELHLLDLRYEALRKRNAKRERQVLCSLSEVGQQLPIVVVSHDVSFVSTHLKHVACLNRRLTCHAVDDVSRETIHRMYHDPVRLVEHRDDCALSDPGCDRGCVDHGKEQSGDG